MTRKMPDLISRDAAKELLDELRWSLDQDGEIAGAEAIEEAIRTIDAIPADEPSKLESKIRKLIDEYKTSLTQGVSKLDTGEEMLGLVVEDLEKIVEGLPAAEGEGKQYAKHVCDSRCLGDNGHHAWPSP